MAAIDCGADALYVGGPSFGAREQARNTLEAIAALIQYAHQYWARVYVTVNTLLTDEELPQAVQLAHELHDLGADGLIIQDAGLLASDLPPIPLIASTQMHNDTPEKIAFLEQVGIQRVILARELSLEEIAQIRRQTAVELECFIHGALCVGYSGQCYLSYALGGRSGNRGQCAQPCRKAYTLVDAQGAVLVRDRHLLSLRDLNLTAHLRELLAAGVYSFKIEGRLKDRNYVMNVVAHYRAALDVLLREQGLSRSSSGTSVIDFTPNPQKTFNRGYSTYHLHGRGEPIGALDTPKMVGEAVGVVSAVTPRGFTLDGDVPLHNGDGIAFFDAHGVLCGTQVNTAQESRITPVRMDGITRGTRMFRNHDHAFLSQLDKSRPQRQIAVTFTLRETAEGVMLHALDEDGVEAVYALDDPPAPAEQPEQALAQIDKQLRKTGGTSFRCREVVIDLPVPRFLPVSTLNALRRGALEQLTVAREAQRPRRSGGVTDSDVPYPVHDLTFRGNVLNARAAAFYRRHGVRQIEPAAESGLNLRGRVVMTSKYCLKHQLGLCPRQGAGKHVDEPLTLIDAEGHRLQLRFDCARCVMEVILATGR